MRSERQRVAEILEGCCDYLSRKDVAEEGFVMYFAAELMARFQISVLRGTTNRPLPELMLILETVAVLWSLKCTKGNQVHAAKRLGISRNTLRSRMKLAGERADLRGLVAGLGVGGYIKPKYLVPAGV